MERVNPSPSPIIIQKADKIVKFFLKFFRMVAGVGVEPTETGL